MTEKRYKLSKPNGAYLIDNDRLYAHWINDDDKIIDLLNEQNEINEQLKKSVKRQQGSNNECSKYIEEAIKENEQLKEERNYFERKKCEYFNKYNKKHLDNIQLKEENEQLKQQLSSINQLIDNKIDEFKNGDYGDLPCNTIHMFLDLKEELGDFE